MSYCRWSHGSDVYVYEDVNGGWTTHVAGSRHSNPAPYPEMPKEWWLMPVGEAMALHRAQQNWYKAATTVPIGFDLDGQSFNDETPGECADRLEELRGMGYDVPQYAIDLLREEGNESTDRSEKRSDSEDTGARA